MNSLRARLPWIGGVAVAAAVFLVAMHFVYTAPREAVQKEIDATQGNISGFESLLKGEFDLRKRAKQIGSTTLASQLDILEHRFRSGLSRIGEQEGLAGVVVDDGQPTDQLNPLLSVRGVPSVMKTAMRKSPDFQLVRGSLKGVGTLEQVLKAEAVVEAQPWVHRIEGFSIRPQGPGRDKFELRLDVATIFATAPEFMSKSETDAPQVASVGPDAEPMWRAVAMKNVFKKPSPAGPRPVDIAHAPDGGQPGAPAQVFAPYEDWKLTGVMSGSHGPEAFFKNVKTGAELTVERGGQVLDAVLVEGAGEEIVVEIGGKRFVLSNGQTLAARRPQG
jgi:hypothetical protein